MLEDARTLDDEASRACADIPALVVAETADPDATLLRWEPPYGGPDDEVYAVVATHVHPERIVGVAAVVADGRPALELRVNHTQMERAHLRELLREIVTESERLFLLWHPDVPTDGA